MKVHLEWHPRVSGSLNHTNKCLNEMPASLWEEPTTYIYTSWLEVIKLNVEQKWR